MYTEDSKSNDFICYCVSQGDGVGTQGPPPGLHPLARHGQQFDI